MTTKRVRLGRGLGALIKEVPVHEPLNPPSKNVVYLPVNQVRHSPWQPRKVMAREALNDLMHSIRERGVLQPLLVRKVDDYFELIAGERRLRAAQAAQLKEVPAMVMDVSEREALEHGLIENLHPEDLNLIEEAEGYQLLSKKFRLTQEQVAERVGKGRATIANALRVLSLPDAVKARIAKGEITAGHAKVLLAVDASEKQESLAIRVAREDLSVRRLEKIVNQLKMPSKKPRSERADIPATHLQYLAEKLYQQLGTSVRIFPSKTLANGKKVRGRIEVDYYSPEDLDRLLAMLGFKEDI